MAGGRGRISKKALQDFLSEAQDIVEQLSRDLLQLDDQSKRGRVDPDVLNDAFRAAHSLKGMSGMFGVERMSTLAHRLEDLMDALRMGRITLDPTLMDLLFEGIETLTLAISEVSQGDDGSSAKGSRARISELAERIGSHLEGRADSTAEDPLDQVELPSTVIEVLTEYEEHRLRENIRQGANLFRVRASFDLMTFDRDLSDLSKRVKEVGEVISTLPSADATSESAIDFELIVGTDEGRGQLQAATGGLAQEVLPIARKGAPPAVPEPPSRPPQQVGAYVARLADDDADAVAAEELAREIAAPEDFGSLRSVARTVRVDIGRLDALMNVVGELVLSKTNIQRISDALKERHGMSGVAADLYKETRNLERKIEELQTGVLDVRMVPLGQIFDKLSRMVRKIGRESGKELDLQVSGGETELDKLIVEDLSDPLMHLIRNSIDHGIESPAARERAGKVRAGRIHLRAYQKGNHVTIEVSDDGMGMNEAAIVDTALRKQLISAHQVGELSRRDILNLVFVPGFSTRSEVSDLSGRGVGLDVVKTNVSRLSGVIDVQSAPGEGTTFAMTLPITLAIIQALVVRVAGQVFGVPLNSVLEILRLDVEEIWTVEHQEVIDLRGSTVPLVHLGELFELGKRDPASRRFYVVVVGLAQNRLAVAVDTLLGQQDVVIKSLGRRLSGVRGIAGATDLGDQRTTLVLDVAGLIEEVLEGVDTHAMVG